MQRWSAAATEAIAAKIEADADASVPAYDGWVRRDLALHVVRVYGNATIALRSGSVERPRPELPVAREDPPARLGEAVREALAEVEAALETCDYDPVWTPVGPRSARFWRRRILREAVLHRWDAQQGRGPAAAPEVPQALELIDEFLDTDVPRAFAAGEHPGKGIITIDAGARTWTVDLGRQLVARGAPTTGGTASVSGDAASVWLRLMRREGHPGPVAVDDPDGSAAAFTGMIDRFNTAKR